MAQTLAEIAKSINIAKSSVQNRPQRIFLCGGQIPKDGGVPRSLRAVLMALLDKDHASLRSKIILAEEAADWYHSPNSPHFPNLVDLEDQIGALSSLILLIIESAGSIAELGAFSFIPSFRAKLSVVLESSFQYEHSFIMDGPLAMVEKESKENGGRGGWYAFDWHNKTKPIINSRRALKAADKIIEEILYPAIQKTHGSEIFNAKNLEHQILLAADLIGLSGPLLISEIMEMLEGLDLKTEKKIEQKRVEGFLFLLENLGHLRKTRAGHYDFYVPSADSPGFISYYSVTGKPIKRDGLGADISKILKKLPRLDYRKAAFKNSQRVKVTQ